MICLAISISRCTYSSIYLEQNTFRRGFAIFQAVRFIFQRGHIYEHEIINGSCPLSDAVLLSWLEANDIVPGRTANRKAKDYDEF